MDPVIQTFAGFRRSRQGKCDTMPVSRVHKLIFGKILQKGRGQFHEQ
ncbi:hypothetical protein [Faecalibaculum rodentium]|nr:hypothetical protein [Faecalibaculum rodentium]